MSKFTITIEPATATIAFWSTAAMVGLKLTAVLSWPWLAVLSPMLAVSVLLFGVLYPIVCVKLMVRK